MTSRTPSARSSSSPRSLLDRTAGLRAVVHERQRPPWEARTASPTRAMASASPPSTNSASAPASAKARQRSTTEAIPSTESASVRATMTRPVPASTAARTRPAASRHRDDGLAGQVAAALGGDLVLQVQAGEAGGGVGLGGTPRLQGVAVAGVRVGEQRQPVEHPGHLCGSGRDVGAVHEPEVGHAQCDRRGDGAGQADRAGAGPGREPGA